MPVHSRFNLTRTSAVSIPVVFSIALVCLGSRAPARTAPTVEPQNCGSTFIGTWWPVKPEYNPGTLIIAVNPDNLSASYTLPGKPQRVLYGTIAGNVFDGQWFEGPNGQTGGFVAQLYPAEQRVRVKLYNKNQIAIEDTEWTCLKPGPYGVGPGYPPAGGTQTVTPTPTPSPTPVPSPTTVRGDQDTDNFQTFDSLAPAQQVIVLTKRGPRFPVEYDASDLSMRVLVKGGWPVVVDYGLQAGAFATLSIGVEGFKLIGRKLRPEDRSQLNIMLPDEFGTDFRVAKLHIHAVTNDGGPAEFHLFGFAMGQKGVQALRRVNQPESAVQLAMNSAPEELESDYEPLALFDPVPQSGTILQIEVSLPATLRVKQHPEKHIVFGYVSRQDFSEGRWEWWRVVGLHWTKVWQHGTDGPISSNQPKSMQWNGIITSMRLVSTGAHGLHLAAWQKSSGERDWVVARTQYLLTVTE